MATFIKHGECRHRGFGPRTVREALDCVHVTLSDSDFRLVATSLVQGWKVRRGGHWFAMVSE